MSKIKLLGSLLLLVIALAIVATIGAQEFGIKAKKPIFGGACKTCPWGAIADIVKAAMQPYGYDVQICYNCAGGAQESRLVMGAKMPPPMTQGGGNVLGALVPAPPNGPIDF